MNKKSVLNQLNNLDVFTDTSRNLVIDEAWKSQLKQIIIDYVSIDSPFLKQVDSLNFSGSNKEKMLLDEFIEYYKQNKHNASQIIFRLKKHIEENGIKNKGNFITRLSEGWAIFWFSTLLLVWSVFCYGIGVFLTQNKIDREKIDLKQKNDSLFRVTQSFIVNTNKSTNDSTSKGVNSKSNK